MSTVTTFEAAPAAGAIERTLGELARDIPGATAVFRRHRLDFCCGGGATLRDAAQARGIDADAVCSELATLGPQPASPLPDRPAELTQVIVRRFHDVHRRELPELVRLADKVERVHREHPEVPAGLADHLRGMHEELLQHMEKEETILFPMMAQEPPMPLRPPIQRMREEHVDHGEALQRIQALTHELREPADACNTWASLYAGLRKLCDDLVEHIHIENNLLFPRFE
jgi:regulator of cell morphogenesis and NO signaling